jgi:hypothetical protein
VDQELKRFVDQEMSAATAEAVAQLRSRLDARRRGGVVVTLGQRAVAIDPLFLGPIYFVATILIETTSALIAPLVEGMSTVITSFIEIMSGMATAIGDFLASIPNRRRQR